MLIVGCKILLRRRGAGLAALAIGLLAAIIVSMNSIMNHIRAESQALSRLVNIKGTYLILSENTTSITMSRIDPELTSQVSGLSDIRQVFPQKILMMEVGSTYNTSSVYVRSVENIQEFLTFKNAYINGVVAESVGEANVGEVLARILKINLHDKINLTTGGSTLQVEVVGVFTTIAELDVEIVVPMETFNSLHLDDALSMIEFTFKDDFEEEALNRLTQQLPGNVKIIKVQQLSGFVSEVNGQILKFMGFWSSIVYTVVAVASYVVATRIVAESSYELAMLKALGTNKRQIFSLVLTSTVVLALLGSIFGISLGLVGVQVASTALRWITANIDVSPFIQLEETLQILLLTLASSIVGCLYPAYKAAHTMYMEQNL